MLSTLAPRVLSPRVVAEPLQPRGRTAGAPTRVDCRLTTVWGACWPAAAAVAGAVASRSRQPSAASRQREQVRPRRGEAAAVASVARHAQLSWSNSPPLYEFPEQASKSIGPWAGTEELGSFPKPGREELCNFYRLRSLLSPKETAEVLAHVQSRVDFSTESDSVDGSPAFQYRPFEDGSWVDKEFQELLGPFVEERLVPYARARYASPRAALADVLIRRYAPGERSTIGTHFDGQAMVTAVLGLNSAEAYSGGLYVQPEPSASSRAFLPIDAGDVVVHSFDLQHGVFLWGGERYSAIFWLKDSPEAIERKELPWYDALAESGDPDAMYVLARAHETGLCGKEFDVVKAARFYSRSAELGHHMASVGLSRLLSTLHSTGEFPGLPPGAPGLLRRSAEAGFATAQTSLAIALANGQGVDRDNEEAAAWMLRAANQLDVEAAYFMGEFCLYGRGVPEDPEAAVGWFRRSAEAGFPEAQLALGILYQEGEGVEEDLRKARFWFERASKQNIAQADMFLENLDEMEAEG